jgi:hypothetical protein
MKNADEFSTSQYEAISKSLDEFCKEVQKENQPGASGTSIY